MTTSCVGIGIVSETRVAIGDAYILCQGSVCITPNWVQVENVEEEVARFKDAVQSAAQQLHAIRKDIPGNTPPEISEFIDTHLLMLEDKALSDQPIQFIRNDSVTAEWALQLHRDKLINIFEQMEDPYLKTRKDDLDHVITRIQKILLEQSDTSIDNYRGQIILADDLSPADVIVMKRQGIAGFITENGGPMSHTAILARSLDIPAIVGARGIMRCLRHAEPLILDANAGVVLADCNEKQTQSYRKRKASDWTRINQLRLHSDEPATTLDGKSISVMANIELTEDALSALVNGATGVGLYRTEFLYMNRKDIPSEEEHYESYIAVIKSMAGKTVTIRTFDLGADKQSSSTPISSTNPALGLRAIRLCLKEPQLFIPQLRAILRASATGPVRLMLPMLTSTWEVEQVKKLINFVKAQLRSENIDFDDDILIGGMIEVPAAALIANKFAEALDFLSIGTNDLIQYTLAIDRLDDEVNYLYDPAHPAVLRLIKEVIDAANAANIPVSICGEMASELRFIPLLIGMGVEELSMQPLALLDAKQILRRINTEELSLAVDELLAHQDENDLYERVKKLPVH